MPEASTPSPLDCTIGILTWNAPNTLRNSLGSYQSVGLLDHVKETIVFLQGNNQKERRIANKFGCKILDSKENIGIHGAIEALLHATKTEYFLFLENDWVCVASSQDVRNTLREAITILHDNTAHCVRLRHKYKYGEPLHSRHFAGREMDRPTHLLNCVHWLEHPEQAFPGILKSIRIGKGAYILTDSRYANYTNNPCVYRTTFFKDVLSKCAVAQQVDDDSLRAYAMTKHVSPHLVALESTMQPWWEKQNFFIAQGTGLFCHDPQKEAKEIFFRLKRIIKKVLWASIKNKTCNT